MSSSFGTEVLLALLHVYIETLFAVVRKWVLVKFGWIAHPKNAQQYILTMYQKKSMKLGGGLFFIQLHFSQVFKKRNKGYWQSKSSMTKLIPSVVNNSYRFLSTGYNPKPFDVKILDDYLHTTQKIKFESKSLSEKIESQTHYDIFLWHQTESDEPVFKQEK